MPLFDTSTEFGSRVEDRLSFERIAWLITVDASGTPQPSPIWFLWEDGSMLIYSQPNTSKLRNLAQNSQAAVHLEGNGRGGDIVTFTGTAKVDEQAGPASENESFCRKYRTGFLSLGMTAEQFSNAYSVPVRFTPERLRGH